MKQSTSRILMVRPFKFGFNPETAESNAFQTDIGLGADETARMAIAEFDAMVEGLRSDDIEVVVVDDVRDSETPDAVFPNNVFSTHSDGTICVYPMEANARRLERTLLNRVLNYGENPQLFDLTKFEKEGMYLEGTGSLVLDRLNKIAFACVSTRTHPELVTAWTERMGYQACLFSAVDADGKPVYHTNVMMCVGTEFAVACTGSIADKKEKAKFLDSIHQTGRDLIEISVEQMYSFAGNMLELRSKRGAPIVAMSETARSSLTNEQTERLSKHCRIASFSIDTIEKCGGGSVRCMIAELF